MAATISKPRWMNASRRWRGLERDIQLMDRAWRVSRKSGDDHQVQNLQDENRFSGNENLQSETSTTAIANHFGQTYTIIRAESCHLQISRSLQYMQINRIIELPQKGTGYRLPQRWRKNYFRSIMITRHIWTP